MGKKSERKNELRRDRLLRELDERRERDKKRDQPTEREPDDLSAEEQRRETESALGK